MKANIDVRFEAQKKDVRLWEVAQELNITDSNLSRKLRVELSATEKLRIINIINEIAAKKKNAAV